MSIIHRARASEIWPVIPIVGPPAIWSIHLLVCYFMAAATTVLGVTGMRVEIGIATVVALGAIAGCAAVANDQRVPHKGAGEPSDLPPFVRSLGFANCLLFGLAVLFTLVPALVLRGFS
jgi:hypothetical protein